jgi:hypothetical protein
MATKKPELLKLVDWAESLGYEVFFDKAGGNNICFETKTIEISSKVKVEERIYILSHECGHILTNKKRGLPYTKASSDDKKKINRLWEEMFSWVEARKILTDLQISFNEKRFSAYAAKCLANYLYAFATEKEI